MTREEMWKEFENQLKREVHTPVTMSYDDSVRCAELGIEGVVTKWKERLEQEPCDCISREQALEALGEAPYVWAECDAELQAYEDWRTIKEMLERLPSVTPKESKWIPVSEGLPEKNMACLVTVGEWNLVQIAIYSDLMGTINHRIFYQGTYGKDDFRDITQYVKAWQPLPAGYQGE